MCSRFCMVCVFPVRMRPKRLCQPPENNLVDPERNSTMESLMYCEINLLCAVILAIMAVKVMRMGLDNSPKKTTFVAAILFAMAMNLFDSLWKPASELWHAPQTVLYILNSLYFAAMGTAAFLWLCFSEIYRKVRLTKNKLLFSIVIAPLVALYVLCIVTPFTGWFFYFNEAGEYTRGPIFYLQYVLGYGYVAAASVINLLGVVSRKNFANKEDYAVMLSFALPPIICAVLQAIFQDLPILSVSPTISFLLIYTSSLQSQICLDPLTGINNRRKLLMELSEKIKKLSDGKDLYFLFLDVDSFKDINDTHGHFEGDRTLQLIGDALSEVCAETGGVCARYGGDEFVVLQELDEGDDVNEICDKVHERIGNIHKIGSYDYPVSVSIGCTKYNASDDVQSLIARADRIMYANKPNKLSD